MKFQYQYNLINSIKVGIFAGVVMGISVLGHFVSETAAADDFTPRPKPVDAESLKPHAGLLLGVANPNGPTSAAFNYGVDVGIQPYVPFGLGLQFNRFDSGDSGDPLGNEMTRMSILAKGTYNFGGDIYIVQSSYLGMKAGAVFDETRGRDTTRFGFGPMIGFDQPVMPNWTLGLEAGYLAVIGHESADSASLNGAIKYWF